MNKKKGFTLVELILVIALIGVFISAIFAPIISSLRNYNKQSEKASLISDTRATMDYLTREIRKSDPELVGLDGRNLKLGNNIYKLEDRKLFKNDIKVREGIDEMHIEKNEKKIIIKITIEGYKLSSELNLRTREGEEHGR